MCGALGQQVQLLVYVQMELSREEVQSFVGADSRVHDASKWLHDFRAVAHGESRQTAAAMSGFRAMVLKNDCMIFINYAQSRHRYLFKRGLVCKP